jgi:tRNA dimethylallyltransferase
MIDYKHKIFCLIGPTAIGKTQFALQLIKYFPFEIISVDSVMIYRGMDIGAAKPTEHELRLVPHHLINICEPTESYSVGRFHSDALRSIKEIHSRGKIPLLVGGTMLYFYALQYGISILPRSDKIRSQIKSILDNKGLDELYLKLQKIDYESAKFIKSSDSQRIQRALEIYEITGKTLSELKRIYPPQKIPYKIINLIIYPSEIAKLRERINLRFQKMISSGFVAEVQKLYRRQDLNLNLPAMRAVGYRQIWHYLDSEISYAEMIKIVPTLTWHLAKRQITWLRRFHGAHWFCSDELDIMNNIIQFCSEQITAIE